MSVNLRQNFNYYEGNCNTPPSTDFSTLAGKKIILIGAANLDPEFQRPQLEFLRQFATERHTLLVDRLPLFQKIAPQAVPKFSRLNPGLVIEGFGKKTPSKTPKLTYVETMNKIHAHEQAHEKNCEEEKIYFFGLAELLRKFRDDTTIHFNGKTLYGSAGSIDAIVNYFREKQPSNSAAEVNNTANAVSLATASDETNPFVSSRLLLQAIQNVVGFRDKVFVLASELLFIGNDVFYTELDRIGVSYGTLLPITPNERTVNWSEKTYKRPDVCIELLLFTVQPNDVRVYTDSLRIPKKYLSLFKDVLEELTAPEAIPRIYVHTEINRALQTPALQYIVAIPARTQALLPIVDYQSLSNFVACCKKSDEDDNYYALFDQLVFSMNIGVVNAESYRGKRELMIIDNKWYLSFYGTLTPSIMINLSRDRRWTRAVDLLHEIQKRGSAYIVEAGLVVLFTDFKKDEIEELIESPDKFVEVLDRYAPPGTHVKVDGHYEVFAEADADTSLTAISQVSIEVESFDQQVGSKRNSYEPLRSSKKQDLNQDLEEVQSALDRVTINDDED